MRSVATHPARHLRRGFTLIEVSLVVIIIGIIAVSAIPAFATLAGSRRAAAGAEIERYFARARALAVAEGRPHGVRVNPTTGELVPWSISSPGAAPSAPQTSDGRTDTGFLLSALFPGVEISSFTNGDGTSSTGTVWFGIDGTPQTRASDGTLVGSFTQDASIKLRDGDTITITRYTGAISR